MTVVIVLMTSCQVSEKWNVGPVSTQTKMTSTAQTKAHALPSSTAERRAKIRNASFTTQKISRSSSCSFSFSV